MKNVAMLVMVGFASTAVGAVEDAAGPPASSAATSSAATSSAQASSAETSSAETSSAATSSAQASSAETSSAETSNDADQASPTIAHETPGEPTDVPAEVAPDEFGYRLLAAAIVTAPVVIAGIIAAYLVPLGLGSPIFPLIAVVLPGATAGIASLFVGPAHWFWVPMLGATAGTVVGLISGAALGLGALAVVPTNLVEGDRNAFILLPTMALFTGLGAGVGAGATTLLVAGPKDAE